MLSRANIRLSALRSQNAVRICFSRSISTPSTGHEESDIVIVGGGPAGLALASALASKQEVRDSLRVTLIEAGDLSKVRNWAPSNGTFSNRVSSLTNASQAFLKDTGAWPHVDESRTCQVEEMQVWDGISDARITFAASELGLAPGEGMSRLTENLNLQRGLLRYLDSVPDVQLLDKVKVQSIARDDAVRGNWPLVQLDDGRVLRARLLIGADGPNSPVRSYAQIPSFGWSYDTQAIVATMSHPPRGAFQGPNTTAYQRFLPTGPIAFLPVSPTASSLVWSTKPPLASALLASDPAVLARMINAAFRLPDVSMRYLHKLILEHQAQGTPLTESQIAQEILWRENSHGIDINSAYTSSSADATSLNNVGIPPADSELLPPLVTSIQTGTAASFPLRFNHTEMYIGEGEGSRTVLVGDAAHTVHPLAGQGLNLGLGDVECLARCIHEAVLKGGDIGSYTSLLPYTQERYLENHKLMSAMDKLHKLYASTAGPVVAARSMGLEVLNEMDSIKAAIMMTAGANAGKTSAGGTRASVFGLAAAGVEGAVGLMNAAKMVRDGVSGIVMSSLTQLVKNSRSSDDVRDGKEGMR